MPKTLFFLFIDKNILYRRCDQDNVQDPTESRRRRQEAPPLDPAEVEISDN